MKTLSREKIEMNLCRAFIIALAMYTRIPVPKVNWDEESMKYAMCFFPVAGMFVGGIQFLVGWLLLEYTACGTLFFAIVMTILPIIITGGIHLDGFIDTMDALCSYGEREKKLEILKDPHIGAFALISLCCFLLLSVGVWSELPIAENRLVLLGIIAQFYILSRSLSGISVMVFPSAKKNGLLKTFQAMAKRNRVRNVLCVWFVFSVIGVLGTSFLLNGSVLLGGIAVFSAILVFGHYAWISKKQFGGTTGDIAGYFLQVCELIILMVIILGGKLL